MLAKLTTGWRRTLIVGSGVWLLCVLVFAVVTYEWSSQARIRKEFSTDLLMALDQRLTGAGCSERKGLFLAAGLMNIDPTMSPPPATSFDSQWKAMSWNSTGFNGRLSPVGAIVSASQWTPKLLAQIACAPRAPEADEMEALLVSSIELAAARAEKSYQQSISKPSNWLILCAAAIVVPLAMLVAGLCIVWVRAGFREPQQGT